MLEPGTERRAFEFRASDDGSTITGIAIPYGEPARIGDFTEIFVPGSVTFADVIANRQHDRQKPLARTGAGLVLTDATDALRARIELPDTTDGRDVRELVRTGVLRGLSAEFRAIEETWEGDTRTIRAATLTGLAVVDRPAYGGASITEAREALEYLTERRQAVVVKPRRKLWPYL